MRRELGEKMGIIASLNKLGNVYYGFGDYDVAQAQYEESLLMARELNAKPNIVIVFNTTSIIAFGSRRSYKSSGAAGRKPGDPA